MSAGVFRPPVPEHLSLPGPAGALEALIEEPERRDAQHFAVVCHPHPLHGGTLHNKVVHTLARTLQELGLPTIRFNFRGVGSSGGEFAHAVGETDDALAVVAWGRSRWAGAVPWLAGFSFGAVVALRAAVPAQAARLITVAPAVTRVPPGEFAMPACPWLIVQGDADDVVDPREVREWAERLSPPPQLRIVAGAGHFFHRRLHDLRDAVLGFAR